MSEEMIIEHCSPTLAGLKTANMFSIGITDDRDIRHEVRKLNHRLRGKGLRVIPLRKTSDHALIYIYRPDHLRRDLSDPLALNILKNKGYRFATPERCIGQLVQRLKNDDTFPHEIGLFLGYPPLDVEGFMKSPCDGVKCSGCWKAYSDPERAEATFRKFKKCKDIYRIMNRKGKSLEQLTVVTS